MSIVLTRIVKRLLIKRETGGAMEVIVLLLKAVVIFLILLFGFVSLLLLLSMAVVFWPVVKGMFPKFESDVARWERQCREFEIAEHRELIAESVRRECKTARELLRLGVASKRFSGYDSRGVCIALLCINGGVQGRKKDTA